MRECAQRSARPPDTPGMPTPIVTHAASMEYIHVVAHLAGPLTLHIDLRARRVDVVLGGVLLRRDQFGRA